MREMNDLQQQILTYIEEKSTYRQVTTYHIVVSSLGLISRGRITYSLKRLKEFGLIKKDRTDKFWLPTFNYDHYHALLEAKLTKKKLPDLSYTKEDLTKVLQRHTGKDPSCDCLCPFTGHSVEMIIRFVGIENEWQPTLIDNACKLSQYFLSKACPIGGNRMVTAASICYIIGIITGNRFTQKELSRFFYITNISIRNRYKAFVRSVDLNSLVKEFWD